LPALLEGSGGGPEAEEVIPISCNCGNGTPAGGAEYAVTIDGSVTTKTTEIDAKVAVAKAKAAGKAASYTRTR